RCRKFRRGSFILTSLSLHLTRSPTSLSAPPPRGATRPRRRASLRILVVPCSLPCDPPVGGHPCNGGGIPRFHPPVRDRGVPCPDGEEKATKLGAEMRSSRPEAMTERMKSDIAKCAAVIGKSRHPEAWLKNASRPR